MIYDNEAWLRIYLQIIKLGGTTMEQAAELADKGFAEYEERWRK